MAIKLEPVSDDSAWLQKKIDEAAKCNGVVVLERRDYRFSRTINIPLNVRFVTK